MGKISMYDKTMVKTRKENMEIKEILQKISI